MVNLLQVIYLWLYSVEALYGKFIAGNFFVLYSVEALYGKFIAGNLFVAIFSKVIAW